LGTDNEGTVGGFGIAAIGEGIFTEEGDGLGTGLGARFNLGGMGEPGEPGLGSLVSGKTIRTVSLLGSDI
jgi:hypothetical protein